MNNDNAPVRLAVELDETAPDPVKIVEHILNRGGPIAHAVDPTFDTPAVALKRFVTVHLARRDLMDALARLEASADVISVTPEPDAEF